MRSCHHNHVNGTDKENLHGATYSERIRNFCCYFCGVVLAFPKKMLTHNSLRHARQGKPTNQPASQQRLTETSSILCEIVLITSSKYCLI